MRARAVRAAETWTNIQRRAVQQAEPLIGHMFDATGPIVRVSYIGEVTPEDILAVGQKAAEFDRGCTVILHRLIDVTALTGGPVGYRDVSEFVARRRAVKFANAYKCAVVVSNDLQRGFARMVQTLLDHPQITLEIFPDTKSAEDWLALPLPNPDAT